jgi:ubiquinone/menaquinone biosynthesis C-methylase UbiE
MADREPWDKLHGGNDPRDVSWYRPHLDQSLELIKLTGVAPDAAIIDVGGGASALVDDLLTRGYRNITVVDISDQSLAVARKRLGHRARNVTWRVVDITKAKLPAGEYDLWHDRAVFPCLTNEKDRHAYIERIRRSLRIGGFVIVATFGPEAPENASGLPIARHSAEALQVAFGDSFRLVEKRDEFHRTPSGSEQEHVYCLCLKDGG